MAWDQPGEAGAHGGAGGFAVPPMPSRPPTPPVPPDPVRAVAVALLNLSGLGLGYALLRRWWFAAACWAATGALLAVALPADPDGVPAGAVAGYLALLGLAAVHGGLRGLRARLAWPPRSPVAALLGLALLAAPAGGYALYDGARDEAVQRMLLDRLDRADRLVSAAGHRPFRAAGGDYRRALDAYRDLLDDHPGSRAARRVPDRLATFYATVGAPYEQQRYCDALEPLRYLRTVSGTLGGQAPGSLATWPDDRLATSLYACGTGRLGAGTGVGELSELLTSFPGSRQAARVAPAFADAVGKAAAALPGADPCPATERLRTLGSQASTLAGRKSAASAALREQARRAAGRVRSGTYACGVDQYRDGDFAAALRTMNGFVRAYRDDRNRERAQKIAIAAEIAREEPAAGRRLPTTASGGSISVTVLNDSPDEVEILYTGPVTGSFTLGACGSCTLYPSEAAARATACEDSGGAYPRRTIRLPAGTSYFLHKSRDGATAATPGTDTAEIEPGYTYTECAYTVRTTGFGSGGGGGTGGV
ncbi:hypothetical protein RKE29_25360 [Streptomyces sp. B1866]|uniref:hypothetical protein n=1 Tax=Streptomyces sp. B1866 TaxID=3075431 RepID=UPI00289026D0|nr:hypothetical protein [Streptomyces sp. B1866]MDT3399919.1 hypothetical protein [Streptomyces sp. B1866]